MVVKELVALLGIKTDPASQKRAEGGMGKLIKVAKAAAAAFAGLKIVQFFKGMINEVASLGDRFDKLSKRTGIATQTLQELEHAAELSGASLGDVETGIRKLQAAQVEAADGVETYTSEFERMGVSVKDEQGNLKDTTELFIELADGMKGLETDAERSAVAMKLLGRGGVALIPMFKEGSDALREMMEEMSQLGAVMDEELIQSSADFIDNQRRMEVSIRGVKNAIAKEVLPQINELTSGLIEYWKVNGQIVRQRMGQFFGGVARVIASNVKFWAGLLKQVINFVSELSPMQKRLLAVGAAIKIIGALLRAGPIGQFLLLASIIALMIDDFQTWKEGGKSAIGTIMEELGKLLGIDLTFEQWSQDMDLFAKRSEETLGALAAGAAESFANLGMFLSEVWDDPEAAAEDFMKRQLEIWDTFLPEVQKGLDFLGIDFDITLQGMTKSWQETWTSIFNWFSSTFIDPVKNLFLGLWGDMTILLNHMRDVFVNWFNESVNLITGPFKQARALLKQFGVVGGGAQQTGTAPAASASPRGGQSVVNAPRTTVQVDVKGTAGMNEAGLAQEVGRVVEGVIERQNRAAMRALTPIASPGV